MIDSLPDAISLDLDDTLWPTVPTLLAAERAMREWLEQHASRMAARFDDSEMRRMRADLIEREPAHAHDMTWVRLQSLREMAAQAGEAGDIAERAMVVFLEARQRIHPYDEVNHVLERWSRRVPLVGVTNGNADVFRTPLGIHFDAAVRADEIGCAKPDAQIFLAAARAVGIAPQRVLHIGDDLERDVRGAERAGMQRVWLLREATHVPGANDEVSFSSLEQVDRWLDARSEGLWSRRSRTRR